MRVVNRLVVYKIMTDDKVEQGLGSPDASLLPARPTYPSFCHLIQPLTIRNQVDVEWWPESWF